MIRPATLEDAAALAAVEVGAMLAGYAEWAEETGALPTIPEEVKAWRDALQAGAARVWLAEVDGNAAGLVAVSRVRLDGLFVLPEQWGSGVGGALLETAEGVLREHGTRAATLWVYEENTRARGFYERRGWVLDARADRGPLGPQVQLRKEL